MRTFATMKRWFGILLTLLLTIGNIHAQEEEITDELEDELNLSLN